MLHVYTLGATYISAGSFSIKSNSPRRFGLLFRLAADAGRQISRTALHELLFPDQTEANARHSLREAIYQLRRSGVAVESDNDGVSLATESVQSDYVLTLKAERLTLEHIKACAGGFLPGYAPGFSEAYSEWLDGLRARTTFALCRALLNEARTSKAEGNWRRTEDAARACIALESLNEEAILVLAEALAIGGSKSQAVKLLDEYVAEVGILGSEIKVPAQILRRRITDRKEGVRVAAIPLESQFVGRTREMSTLRDKFEQARAGQGSCAIISGPAGIGKSRLALEFLAGISFDASHTIRVSLHAHDKYRPLSGFFEAIHMLRKLPGSLGCAPEDIIALDGVVGRAATQPQLGQFRAINSDRDAVIHALIDLFCAVASETFLVCWIDDAHWCDSATREAIAALSSRFRELRIFLLLTTREPREFLDSMRHSRDVLHMSLSPLDENATLSLIDDALQSRSPKCTASARWRIASTAAGNPLFALSLASHLQSNGEAFGIPKTLWESFAHLVDGIGPSPISVLATVIALGRNATIQRLTEALEMRHGELLESLVELSERGLIDEIEGVVNPGHPLVAEVFKTKAAPVVLRFAYARVAHQLRSNAPSDPSLLWDAAECFIAAGNKLDAFDALRACAAQARAIGRPREAAQTLSRACSLAVNASDLEAAARELIAVADSALEPQLTMEGVRYLRAAGVPHSHDDAELSELRCLLRTNRVNNAFEARLLDCTNATDASPAHRSKAALWLLKYADATGKDSLIELAAETFAAQDANVVDPLDRLEFALIHASATNNIGGMAAAASSLIEAAEQVPLAARLPYLFNASVGLVNAGRTQDAIALFRKIYNLSDATRGVQERILAATHLAGLFNDLGDDIAATDWMSRAQEASAEHHDASPNFDLTILVIERAMALGQFDHANSLFRQAREASVFCDGQLRERWGRAIDVRLRTELQFPTSSDEAYAVEVAQSGPRSVSGIRDFEIATACTALVRLDRANEAQAILDDYLARGRTTRREIPASLRRLSGIACRCLRGHEDSISS